MDAAPLIISIAGALIAFLATALVAVLAFLGKFTLTTLDKRIDDAKARIVKLEESNATHAAQLASAKTQTEAENRRFEEFAEALSGLRTELREDISQLVTSVNELNVAVRRNVTPSYNTKIRQP